MPRRRSALALLLFAAPPPPPPAPAPAPAPAAPAGHASPSASVRPGPTHQALPPGPSLRACQQAALDQLGLPADQPRRWQRRARRSALAPEVQTSYELRVDRGLGLDQEAGTADALSTDLGHVHVGRVRLTWALDRAVFNPDELRALRASLDLLDWRRQVLAEITGLYFERVRLWQARSSSAADPEADLALREVQGLLEALTGLAFPSPSDLLR